MLTQQQINEFHHNGFLILRGVFTGRELELLRAAGDEVMREGVAREGKDHSYYDFDDHQTYYRSENMWERGAIFKAVTMNPTLLEAVGQCIGHPFLPINDSFVCKIPGGNVPVLWHQDPPYGFSKEPKLETFEVPNFDVDIYLDDSTIENGCVWGINGHHLVGKVQLQNFTEDELFENSGAAPMEMKAGDVLFHSISGPHGSRGNTTTSVRRIFYVHYMAHEVVEGCYPGWQGKNAGFSESGVAYVRTMIDDRKTLGLGGKGDSPIQLTPAGFVVDSTTAPATPPNHWGTLIAVMTEQKKNDKRTLAA